MMTTATWIGIALAATVGGLARWSGLDRDRAFYPTVMIVIASYYVLFAAMGGGSAAIVGETGIGAGFAALAAIGFKRSQWWVVVALVGHGVFDWVHPHLLENGGVPAWWPAFCSAYDITAGVVLGGLLLTEGKSRDRRAEAV